MSEIQKPTSESATPEQTLASPETPPTTETTSPVSNAAAAASAADSGDDGNNPHERPRARTRTRKRAQGMASASSHRHADASTSGERGLAERLLALLALPHAALDRRLLPAPLLGALDAAGLGTADQLPSALNATLAAIGAVAGPAVQCEPIADRPGSLSLRVALLAEDRRLPLVPAPVLAAAYAAVNDALDAYNAAVESGAAQRRLTADRRRLASREGDECRRRARYRAAAAFARAGHDAAGASPAHRRCRRRQHRHTMVGKFIVAFVTRRQTRGLQLRFR